MIANDVCHCHGMFSLANNKTHHIPSSSRPEDAS